MRGTRRWFCVLAPIPYLLLAVALIDWLQIPLEVLVGDPWLALTSAAVAASNTFELMWPLVLAHGLIAAILVGLSSGRRAIPIAALAAVCAAIVGFAYLVLVRYHPFDGYPPFLGACAALWIGLTVSYVAVLFEHRRRVVVTVAGAVVVVAVIYANATVFTGQYPTLHAMLAMVTYAVAHAAATVGLSLRPAPTRWARWAAPAASVAVVAIVGGALAGDQSGATAYTRAYTTAGQYEIFRGGRLPPDQCLQPVDIPDDSTAQALFEQHAHMPRLPDGFRIDEHNVLLLMIDATRFDDTSLGGSDNTPHLARFAAEGAFFFERAYAPSSRTVVTLASVFDMTYPTHARMRSLMPPWVAALSDDVDTPAELFAAAGHTTFRYTHRFPPRYIAPGYFQGIERGDSWPFKKPGAKPLADPAIADATTAELERLAASGERFFGWVFFIGPHAPYVGTAPVAKGMRGRYRQDLRRTDALIGRVLDTLRETKLLETTVVIVMADHGEEFGEHGVYSHGLSLFEAGTRIPMLLWIPGLRGHAIAEPTSATYLWPTLASTGTESMRALAAARIREHFAPMMAATGGAVITELRDWERHQTALVWRDARAIYDFQSGLYHVYDRAADPRERRNLVAEDRAAAAPYIETLEAYRAVRACHRRSVITTERAQRR